MLRPGRVIVEDEGETNVFKPGDVLVLHVIEEGEGVTIRHDNKVIEYSDGLLKVEQGGKTCVYNMHSRNFVKAEKHD